jgi:hypothetical protein
MDVDPPGAYPEVSPPAVAGRGHGGRAAPLSREVTNALGRGLTCREIAMLAVDPLTGQRLDPMWIGALASARLSRTPEPWQVRALTAAGITPAVSPPPRAAVVRLRFGLGQWVLLQTPSGAAPRDWRELRRKAREFVRHHPETATEAAQPKRLFQFIRVPSPDLGWFPGMTVLYRSGATAAVYCPADQIGEHAASALTTAASQLGRAAIPRQMPSSPRLAVRIERLHPRAFPAGPQPTVGLFTQGGWVAYVRADQITPELAAAIADILTENTRYLLWLPGRPPAANEALGQPRPSHHLRVRAEDRGGGSAVGRNEPELHKPGRHGDQHLPGRALPQLCLLEGVRLKTPARRAATVICPDSPVACRFAPPPGLAGPELP